MSDVRPDLSVVIVTHNGREMALRTLRSARASLGGLQAEWIVADSASTDGTPEAIEREFGDEVEVLRVPNRGFAAGNNIGIAWAQGRYVLLLNPDIEVLEGSFADLIAALDSRPDVGIASVVQRGSDGELQFSMRRFPSPGRDLGESLFAARWPFLTTMQELEMRAGRYRREISADWLCGAFLCARAEAIVSIGPMDERFFLYSEEIDWCLRAHQAGWDVRHLPVMTVTHHAGRRDRGDLMAQLAHSRSLFAHKHHGILGALGIRAALAVGHVLRIALRVPLTPFKPAARERIGAEAKALRVLLGLGKPPLEAEPQARPANPSATVLDEAR
ncbi:MAG TPA: glycosyltransferase family 2 protein [Solirubrobacterales bacterium]|nr:glycosyltransferase family 2 protein [Solirubrobacterales bacterium]